MSEKSENCLACRLISGFGVIAMGTYIFYQAKHRRTLEKNTMKAISAVAVSVGVARLLDLKLLKQNKSKET